MTQPQGVRERLRRALRKAHKTGDWSKAMVLADELMLELTEGNGNTRVAAAKVLAARIEKRAREPKDREGFKAKPLDFKSLGRKSVYEQMREEEQFLDETARVNPVQDKGKSTP